MSHCRHEKQLAGWVCANACRCVGCPTVSAATKQLACSPHLLGPAPGEEAGFLQSQRPHTVWVVAPVLAKAPCRTHAAAVTKVLAFREAGDRSKGARNDASHYTSTAVNFWVTCLQFAARHQAGLEGSLKGLRLWKVMPCCSWKWVTTSARAEPRSQLPVTAVHA